MYLNLFFAYDTPDDYEVEPEHKMYLNRQGKVQVHWNLNVEPEHKMYLNLA